MRAANVVDVASGPSLHQPLTLIFFLAALLCLAITALPVFILNRDRNWERRVYWSGVGGLAACVFFAALPDWNLGAGMALFGVVFLTASAYAYTPYIKIRGKIYAFYLQDGLPDRSPDVTAARGSDDPDYDPAPDSY